MISYYDACVKLVNKGKDYVNAVNKIIAVLPSPSETEDLIGKIEQAEGKAELLGTVMPEQYSEIIEGVKRIDKDPSHISDDIRVLMRAAETVFDKKSKLNRAISEIEEFSKRLKKK